MTIKTNEHAMLLVAVSPAITRRRQGHRENPYDHVVFGDTVWAFYL